MSKLLVAEPSLVIVCKQQKGKRLCCVVPNAPFAALHAFLPANLSDSCLVEVLVEEAACFRIV
jgi:hypothetical protein